MSRSERKRKYYACMSMTDAWALSVGSAIGWGSFVFTGNSYLLKAGPLGSIAGIVIGLVIMLVIGKNYSYLMQRYPDPGGVYTYVSNVFGHDRAFMVAWFLFLTYIAVFWANVTSLPLFAGYFLGDIFKVGPSYNVAGYSVYLSEALISVLFIVLTGIVCMKLKKALLVIVTVMVTVFCAGITFCLIVALMKRDPATYSFSPLLLENRKVLPQILSVACMSPWAFVGFENISHFTREYSFEREKSYRVLTFSVITTALLYIFIVLLSITAYPQRYDSWVSYIADLSNINDPSRYPTFNAAGYYMGSFGIIILMLSLLCLILTSLIGMMTAVSRLLLAIAKDGIIPPAFGRLNDKGIPSRAVAAVTVISLIIPFAGRTAIGWIVDVTTIGTIIVYIFVSASACKSAVINNNKTEKRTGMAGIVMMIFLAVIIQIPSLTGDTGMAKESYFLFTIWGVLGFLFFRIVVSRDTTRRFGNSIIVWIGMLALVLFTSLTWMRESTSSTVSQTLSEVRDFYSEDNGDKVGTDEEKFISDETDKINRITVRNSVVVFGLFVLSSITMFSNYRTMKKRERENDEALGTFQNMAYRDQMTGVKNKHAYAEKEESMNSRIRGDMVEEFAVVVCDVNGLKQINDTLGHKAGDEHIKAASALICRTFKRSPVFRIGGDEFVVTLEGDDYENREKMMGEINRIIEHNNKNGGVVIAMGLSEFIPDDDDDFRQVFDRADALMYARKKQLKGIS